MAAYKAKGSIGANEVGEEERRLAARVELILI